MGEQNSVLLSRRQLVTGLGVGAAMLVAQPALAYSPRRHKKNFWSGGAKEISIKNVHTGERLRNIAFYENGSYNHGALDEINRLLRDHRTGDVTAMDPTLINFLHAVHEEIDSSAEIEIISGYRSPKSNALLARKTRGVAKKSYHMKGQAVDLMIGDRETRDIRKAAIALSAGGVGHYNGRFVHLDTGPVRSWGKA